MVYLLAGPKGTGKTQQMIEQANEAAKKCNGNCRIHKKISPRHSKCNF